MRLFRTNTADPVVFTLTPPECHMEIKNGYGTEGKDIYYRLYVLIDLLAIYIFDSDLVWRIQFIIIQGLNSCLFTRYL